IDEFHGITELSLGIAQQLLFRHPRESLPKVHLPKPRADQMSYSRADVEVTGVEEICRWVTISEYADLTQKTTEAITEEAVTGMLGPIELNANSGERLLIWPQRFSCKPREALPAVGKKSYRVTASTKAAIPIELDTEAGFEESQHTFLHFAHALGKPSEV